ncbi:MAG: NYN domain-containing protein [Saprospiraceae bacterium]|jgi:cold shock CspA family protein/uncharacterized LabA/DUF88 family protein
MAAAVNGSTSLTRIGVFYDGNYFLHVSNYYHYVHERRSRLSLKGLHEYIRQQISQLEDKEVRLCRVVDSHYFRGRLSASEASQRGNLLYYERVFDDILMGEGIVSHYLPVKIINGRRQEKGIDVWLSLEAIEMAFNDHFDVVVLVGSDSDYVPLMRKLNGMGKHTILLSWDFEYTDEEGHRFSTRTSQDLLEEVTYSLPMHEIIDDPSESEFDLNRLFVPKQFDKAFGTKPLEPTEPVVVPPPINLEDHDDIIQLDTDRFESIVLSIKDGYGFIKYPPDNVFFHFSSLKDFDFEELRIGDRVEFKIEAKDNGRLTAEEVFVLE